MDIVNDSEIRFFAIRRSGHHAIIQWVINNCNGMACVLNQPPLKNNIFHHLDEKSHAYVGNCLNRLDLKREVLGDFSQKDYLIYNQESIDLRLLSEGIIENNHDSWVGKSRKRYDVLVLRDPFNNIASHLKHSFDLWEGVCSFDFCQKFAFLWKQYAKEYLGMSNYLGHHKIVLKYNDWAILEEERYSIGKKLGLTIKDNSIDFVPLFGKGSSFDYLNLKGSANQMKILDRWKKYADSELYKGFIDDEMIGLSERIFGHIPGTEIFYPQKCSLLIRKRKSLKSFYEWIKYSLEGHGLFRKILRKLYLKIVDFFYFNFPNTYLYFSQLRIKNKVLSRCCSFLGIE